MIKKSKSRRKLKYVLNNLREADRQEMCELYGENWYSKTLNSIMKTDFVTAISKRTGKPFAIFGHKADEEFKEYGIIFLLSTPEIENKKFSLIKNAAIEIFKIEKQYDMIFNFIHNRNFKMLKLLEQLGFKFLECGEINYKFFYKRKILKGIG